MKCIKCNSENDFEAKYCAGCGCKLTNLTLNQNLELWSPLGAINWSILLTPIFGTYLLYKNAEALGDEDNINKAKYWFVGSIVVYIIPYLLLWILALAGSEKIDSIIGFNLIYLVVWYFTYAKKQMHLTKFKNYVKKEWLKPVLIAIGMRILFFAINVTLMALILL